MMFSNHPVAAVLVPVLVSRDNVCPGAAYPPVCRPDLDSLGCVVHQVAYTRSYYYYYYYYYFECFPGNLPRLEIRFN
jgi:hypothetical protein